MAQSPSFDMNKLSTADKILLGGGFLLFIDSFLAWQRVCVTIIQKICGSANAWGGNGSFAGVLMAIFALLLVAGTLAVVSGVSLPVTLPMSTVLAGLTAGTVLFGVIKFLIVVANHIGFAAWIGLILILAVAYGGYMKMQEQKAVPPAAGFSPPQTGP
jgi:hypothetical protein